MVAIPVSDTHDRMALRGQRPKAVRTFFQNWKEGKWMAFEEFMGHGLYHPEFGYYTTGIDGIGRGGDFSTSATLSEDLGKAIAAWLVERLGQEKNGGFIWHCVEVGAGDGSLAAVVLKNLPLGLRIRCRYHIVEKSPVLTAIQKKRIGGIGSGRLIPVKWHPDMHSVLATCRRFHLFSNELVDAFPASIYQWNGEAEPCPSSTGLHSTGRWDKLYLKLEDGGLFESFRPVSSHELSGLTTISEPINWPGESPPHGQRCEVHFTYREWLHTWVPRMESGSVLTIDYGDKFPAVFSGKKRGTMRAYYQHQLMKENEVYSRFGDQDLTSDVNFSDLEHWSAEVGLNTLDYMTQSDFLNRYVQSEEKGDARRFLESEDGAGTAFKVLLQEKLP